MTFPQITLFSIFGAVMVLMFSGRWRHDLVAFAGLMAAVVLGVVPAEAAFAGFGHPATMVVALILITTAGLMRSGAVAALTRLVVVENRPISLHIAVMSGIGGFLSGFMNNIAALAILMPIDMQVARRAGRAARLTLMPLAFATILGGMLTLIGTPPNLIVSGFRREVLGEPYRMFDFMPVGGAVAIAGIIFIALIGWRLIPKRRADDAQQGERSRPRRYQSQLVVTDETTFLDKSLAEMQEAVRAAGAKLIRHRHHHHEVEAEPADITIASGDVVTILADSELLDEVRSSLKLSYPDGRSEPRARPRGEGREDLIECLVPVGAEIAGRTVQSLGLINRHDSVLIGLRRQGRIITGNLHREIIRPGDLMLLLVSENRLDDLVAALGLLPLEGTGRSVMREWQMALTLGLFVAAVLLTSFGLVTMPIALGCVIVAYVLFGVLSITEIYDFVDWSVVVLLGSMIPLGLALDSTGGSALIAGGLASLTAGFPAWVALALLMVTTMFMSDILNNNATTIIAAPVGIRLAEQLGVNPDAFLMGVAVSAACAFLTPIGHQNNTLIMGPGDYGFGDYWRMGLPLEFIVMLVSVPMLLIVWPL
ncbi:TrkA-C domain-containing protein [Paracoccus isoporae]|uniref:TrkA-C domain-containing protein n=1 Tax=Paracoccus isoporae TaxID=591205 RepID=A0A1G7E9N9_9RHOB|nr:SLC13 family permease [Paracoccus isoporae]SDE60411.1 TrkA-C domain-containing protein [Paracoccus isoporae]